MVAHHAASESARITRSDPARAVETTGGVLEHPRLAKEWLKEALEGCRRVAESGKVTYTAEGCRRSRVATSHFSVSSAAGKKQYPRSAESDDKNAKIHDLQDLIKKSHIQDPGSQYSTII